MPPRVQPQEGHLHPEEVWESPLKNLGRESILMKVPCSLFATMAIKKEGALRSRSILPLLLRAQPLSPPTYRAAREAGEFGTLKQRGHSTGEHPHSQSCLQIQRPVGALRCFAFEGKTFFPCLPFLYSLWKTDTFHRKGPTIILHDGAGQKLGFVLRSAVLTTTTSFLGFFFSTERKRHIVKNQISQTVTIDTIAKISSDKQTFLVLSFWDMSNELYLFSKADPSYYLKSKLLHCILEWESTVADD